MSSAVTQRTELAHRQMVQASFQQVVEYLEDALGRPLVAHMAGVDPKTITRWTSAERTNPRDDSEAKLRTSYQVFQMLAELDSPHTVRAWFIGLNPQLDDTSPASAIHDGNLKDVLVAARAFVRGG